MSGPIDPETIYTKQTCIGKMDPVLLHGMFRGVIANHDAPKVVEALVGSTKGERNTVASCCIPWDIFRLIHCV